MEQISLSDLALKTFKSITQDYAPYQLMTMLQIFNIFKKNYHLTNIIDEFKNILNELVRSNKLVTQTTTKYNLIRYFYTSQIQSKPIGFKSTLEVIEFCRKELLESDQSIASLSSKCNFPLKQIRYSLATCEAIGLVTRRDTGPFKSAVLTWRQDRENSLPNIIDKIKSMNEAGLVVKRV
ncbi:hypothetical protein TVAG_260300 [Trichomonas vaginalis G3]|uniref:Uncharacterized protein n=1 Tax=Trichomonas vaginalis (strain ATCC PRA-98 / G3) TaxID=412133 RepID=A2E8W2_TRIV3|nr:hypothetical protein TVAGG3_0926510 [Trichomonas vaginalis G3]EAY10944.1 hypothetical protein TVAG_260300 [Trichomonas vaginalis G3]KAI5485517.1 hypothetical protein TVAGG3_0926510 [Trichomonas vaginalis G3]|eukprot:XP_001323167.1 hypothetical protein [Trichomonas vaginalis G3]